MEKPTNVLIAEAIGRKSESSTDGRWRVNHVVTDAGGTVHEMWIHPPPYDTDPASAWSALEAWRSSQPFRDYKVASGESVHGGGIIEVELTYGRDCNCVVRNAPTMPAAVCQAILSAEGK